MLISSLVFLHIVQVRLSSNIDKKSINEAISAGGVGYLSKNIAEDEFIHALTKISSGKNYFSRGVQQSVFDNYVNSASSTPLSESRLLTKREVQVVKCIANGMSLKSTGEELFISMRTVETHKKNILVKLNLKNTVELVKFAIINGIIDL